VRVSDNIYAVLPSDPSGVFNTPLKSALAKLVYIKFYMGTHEFPKKFFNIFCQIYVKRVVDIFSKKNFVSLEGMSFSMKILKKKKKKFFSIPFFFFFPYTKQGRKKKKFGSPLSQDRLQMCHYGGDSESP
jgi:hypothetical protein